jgi:hypothetical protein
MEMVLAGFLGMFLTTVFICGIFVVIAFTKKLIRQIRKD